MINRKALTRLDLLILLIIAILLAAILIPATNKHRGERRFICASNLKSIGTTIDIYAANNNDHLPAFPGSKILQWLTDQPPAFLSTLTCVAHAGYAQSLSTESTRKWFYCPDNKSQNPATLANWNGITITGYAFLNDRGKDAPNIPESLPARTPPIQFANRLDASPDPTESELAADWIISDSPDTRTTASFTSVTRSAPGSPTLSFPTSHTDGKQPAGANVLAFDSHVAWRPFNPKTATPIKQPGPAPVYFWLPAPL